ncbi:MAG: FixH family protein [Woeseiaceae bacterium]|nr:FixH family protein [Woeseiaceae bacterium]
MNHALPWHRQFWPWFLISIPAATVCACMFTIYLAVTTSDSLVVSVSAESGVDVVTERALAAEKFAAALDMQGELIYDRDTGLVTLTLTNLPDSAQPTSLSLDFSHPAFVRRDHSIELLPSPSDNVFVGQQMAPMDERWYMVLQQDDWRLTGVWDGAQGYNDRALLSPRGAR